MAKPDLQILIKPQKEHVTVALVGEAHFDISAGQERIEEIVGLKPSAVHVDASKLNFISSTGICFLLNLRNAIHQTKGKVVLVGLQPMVKTALQHARVLNLFDLPAEKLPDAVKK